MINIERKLPLQGTTNLRDLGGYETIDGRTVKWHSLLRSDELADITEEGKAYLQEIDLQLIVDLRSTAERIRKPDPVIKGIQNIHLPVLDGEEHNGNVMEMMVEFAKHPEANNLLIKLYKGIITNETALHAFKRFMNDIVQMEKPIILWHCTAGKDRTGLAAAFLLLTLGVPEKTVMEDYLLTNIYREAFNEATVQQARQSITDEKTIAGLRKLLEVDGAYLQAAIDEMKDKHGSIDHFLEEALDVTEKKRKVLQEKLLD